LSKRSHRGLPLHGRVGRGPRKDSPEQHTFPSGQQNWVPPHTVWFVAQINCCCRDKSLGRTRSPSSRSLARPPFRGRRSASSRRGCPFEVPSVGFKADPNWALVSAKRAESARRVRKRRNCRGTPIPHEGGGQVWMVEDKGPATASRYRARVWLGARSRLAG
jgi:hypothetical protein